ncbi:hypothetical protein ScPMuIL_003013 [Solemya velum]
MSRNIVATRLDRQNDMRPVASSLTKGSTHTFSSGAIYGSSLRWFRGRANHSSQQKQNEEHTWDTINEDRTEPDLFWVAPEHLRTNPDNDVSTSGDVYSFAIILYEIITRDAPYSESTYTVQDVVRKIKAAQNPPFRPSLNVSMIEKPVMILMKECWHENPIYRPTFRLITNRLKDSKWATSEGNFFDSLIRRMEQYANNLEGLVNEKTQAFLEEKRKAEILLYHILPKSVADQLKNGISVDPEAFESVTVYFSDIVDFTSISAESSPMEVSTYTTV